MSSTNNNTNTNACKKQYMFAFDMDGTLLNTKSQVSEKTADYLKQLAQEHGHMVTIVSGRACNRITMHAHNLPPSFYVIAFNGAITGRHHHNHQHNSDDNKTNELLAVSQVMHYKRLPRVAVTAALQVMKQDGATFIMYKGDQFLFNSQAPNYSPEQVQHMKDIGLSVTVVDFVQDILHEDNDNSNYANHISKITFNKQFNAHLPHFSVDWLKQQLIAQCGDIFDKHCELIVMDSSVELVPKGVNKYEALKQLCSEINHPWQQTVVFGDDGNDVEMLEGAHLSISPSNAHQMAKAKAKHVSHLSNDQDWIVHEISKVIAGEHEAAVKL